MSGPTVIPVRPGLASALVEPQWRQCATAGNCIVDGRCGGRGIMYADRDPKASALASLEGVGVSFVGFRVVWSPRDGLRRFICKDPSVSEPTAEERQAFERVVLATAANGETRNPKDEAIFANCIAWLAKQ